MSRFSTWLNGLTEDVTPDMANDFAVTYDASAATSKKVKLSNIAAGASSYFVKIAETVLAAPAANFDFTSIPGTYRHLKIIVQARSSTAAFFQDIHMHFNNDTSANYDVQINTSVNTTPGANAVVASANNYIGEITAASTAANFAGSLEITVPNYAGTTFYKNYICLNGHARGVAAADQNSWYTTGQWRNTAAITRVTIFPTSGNFIIGSVATLYGMA